MKKMKCCLAVNHNVYAPKCFSCGVPATHVSATVNPAGYHDYQCIDHAVDDPSATRGSDPGWNTAYHGLSSPAGLRVWQWDMDRRRRELRSKGMTDAQIDAAIAKAKGTTS